MNRFVLSSRKRIELRNHYNSAKRSIENHYFNHLIYINLLLFFRSLSFSTKIRNSNSHINFKIQIKFSCVFDIILASVHSLNDFNSILTNECVFLFRYLYAGCHPMWRGPSLSFLARESLMPPSWPLVLTVARKSWRISISLWALNNNCF